MEYSEDSLRELRFSLPEDPGIYKYLDEKNRIIYVGKAKNLRKRVNSYFTKQHSIDYKTRILVSRIRDIQYTITNTEREALILENSLIKQYQPRYNVMLKDGKTYPYICIKNERFPRVFPTRTKEKDGSTYFGPYPNVRAMNSILDFIRKNFKLRTCNLALAEKNILSGKFKVCLEFHIGNCKGPCIGAQQETSYNQDIDSIRQLLKGNYSTLLHYLKQSMLECAEQLDFEQAQELKEKISFIERYKEKATVVSENISQIEVVTIRTVEDLSVINHFRILNGIIIQTHAFDVRKKEFQDEEEVLVAAISKLAAESEEFYPEVISNIPLTSQADVLPFTVTVPLRGDKARLVQLSEKNCLSLLREKILQTDAKKKREYPEVLELLQKDLNLSGVPRHIECFDNSNFQGSFPVASMVVFIDGKPARREYRTFNIKTVVGIDDFASMKEIVTRRYSRLLAEQKKLPDLVVVDGGKGQLSSAAEALTELGLGTTLPIVGIAKRLEEIYYKNDPVPVHISKKSPSLKLLQHIRNEAHKTAIEFHRKKRLGGTLKTRLTEIEGIGKVTAQKLLTHFRSISRLMQASESEIIEISGQVRAVPILEWRKTQQILEENDPKENLSKDKD
jgi:excinuclease ABC subunit C